MLILTSVLKCGCGKVDHPEKGRINICTKMIEEGHARPYNGGTKVPWITEGEVK